MLVTFRTSAFGNVIMFGDVAKELLKLMGRSDTIPSAILPADIPNALTQLKAALQKEAESANPDETDEDTEERDDPAVSIGTRALPLIELLQAAAKEDVAVMWES